MFKALKKKQLILENVVEGMVQEIVAHKRLSSEKKTVIGEKNNQTLSSERFGRPISRSPTYSIKQAAIFT